jgi:hypothetical protein
MRSTLMMESRGLAAFPDGGGSITLRQVADVWICDPQQRIARRVATIPQPGWIGGTFTVWMTDWTSQGEGSSLHLRVSGTKGGTSGARRVIQRVRVDFDRHTIGNSNVVYLNSPHIEMKSIGDMVNPGNEYGIMDVRRQGDTLLVWTDRSLDWRSRFLINKVSGIISPLDRVPRRSSPTADSVVAGDSTYDTVCPESIRGMPSPTESRICFGDVEALPVATATITRVDASCAQRRYPRVGSERDGETGFFIGATAWITYEIEDEEGLESGQGYGEEVIFEAVSASGVVLGSDSMGFAATRGVRFTTMSLEIGDMKPEDVSRVARVVARWDRTR